MPKPTPSARSRPRTPRALLLPSLLLSAALAGCATRSQPLASPPVPRLTLPALPDSAKQPSKPQICSETCSLGLMNLLVELERLRSKQASSLTNPGSPAEPASPPTTP